MPNEHQYQLLSKCNQYKYKMHLHHLEFCGKYNSNQFTDNDTTTGKVRQWQCRILVLIYEIKSSIL